MDILNQLHPQFIKDPHTQQNKFAFLPLEEYELVLKDNETLQNELNEITTALKNAEAQIAALETAKAEAEAAKVEEPVAEEKIPVEEVYEKAEAVTPVEDVQEEVEEEEPVFELTLEL